MFLKNEWKLLWPFYVSEIFLTGFLIFPAYYVIYFLELGFSIIQIGFIASMFSLAGFLFELPTGVFADVYGRKRSVIVGLVMTALCFTCIGFTTSYPLIIFLFFLAGAFQTFISGAEDAWVVDLIKNKSLVNEFYRKRHFIGSAGLLFAGLFGSILVYYNSIHFIWLITGVGLFISALILMIPKEISFKHYSRALLSQLYASWSYIKNNAKIRKVIFAGYMVASPNAFFDILWIPLLLSVGLQEEWFGVLSSFTFLLGIFASLMVMQLLKKFKDEENFFSLLLVFQIVILFSIALFGNFYSTLFLYVLFVLCNEFFIIRITPYFQHHIPSAQRATLGSINAMGRSLMYAVLPIIASFLVFYFGLSMTLLFTSFFLIIGIIMFQNLKKH